jgi:hypothetical protein
MSFCFSTDLNPLLLNFNTHFLFIFISKQISIFKEDGGHSKVHINRRNPLKMQPTREFQTMGRLGQYIPWIIGLHPVFISTWGRSIVTGRANAASNFSCLWRDSIRIPFLANCLADHTRALGFWPIYFSRTHFRKYFLIHYRFGENATQRNTNL